VVVVGSGVVDVVASGVVDVVVVGCETAHGPPARPL
jgi:hypothetical protein